MTGSAVRPETAGRAPGDVGTVESEVELATKTSKDELQRRFTELLGANGPALGRLAASYTRSVGDRDDLFQEIALAIWRALPRFRGECSERTFIFRIAHNRAISHIAQRSPISALEGELDPADPRPNPEREVSRAQQEERLLQAIRRLPITYRQAITLSLEGMSYSEIAEILGVGESNVGVRLNRARNLLREMLEVGHERR